jgi:hypothetical protein
MAAYIFRFAMRHAAEEEAKRDTAPKDASHAH